MKKSRPSNDSLAIRLSGYTAAAGALLALAPNLKGQVTYSGPQNLEVNLPDEYIEIDIDGDLVDDFVFYAYGYSYMSTYGPYFFRDAIGAGIILNARTDSYANSWITKMTTARTIYSSYAGTSIQYYTALPDALEAGEIIDSNRNLWGNGTSLSASNILGLYYSVTYNGFYGLISSSFEAGDFLGKEKYVGMRFFIGAEQHYGWIRVSLGDKVDPITILDWAYESTPDEKILAGEGLIADLPPNLLIKGGNYPSADSVRTLTIVASEPVTGFDVNDFVVTNGTTSNFTEVTPGLEYTVDVKAAVEGKVSVLIPDSVATDATSHPNTPSETSWHLDLTSPKLDFRMYDTITNYANYWFSPEFSEAVDGLEESDFIISNGSVINFYFEPWSRWCDIEVAAADEGTVSIKIPAGAFHDRAGNLNEADSVHWMYDITGPVVTLDPGISTTSEPTVQVDIAFNEPVLYLGLESIMVTNGSATLLQTVASNIHFTATVVADHAGSVIVYLLDGAAFDFAGNPNLVSSTSWEYQPVGINNIHTNGISIYPNPVNSSLHIKLEVESTVRIIDINGRMVFEQDRLLEDTIDVSGYNPGVYTIQIQNANNLTQHKIVIE